MKTSPFHLIALWITLSYLGLQQPLFSAEIAPKEMKKLQIGDTAPDFDLLGIDEEKHQLASYAKAKLLMVIFISNHCPTSQAAEGRLKKIVSDFKDQGLQVIAINPNDPAALRPDELGYSKYNDSFPEMKRHAKEQDFTFPYLFDGETQAVAKAYGCLATPHVFLFDSERKLRYQGRLDDSRYPDPSTVSSPDARLAIEALLANKPVPVAETKIHGCSTKWIEKRAAVAADHESWEKEEVHVELIDAAGVATLRANTSQKVRFFNVWATWCGPCVDEFPELVATARKFGLRDFEFITISINDPSELGEVKAFLEKNNAVVPKKIKPTLQTEGRKGNAYVYNAANTDALIQALDPEWPGSIPHTLVVAPGGKVIFRHTEEVDGEELRKAILDYMGPYWTPEKP